MTAASWGLLDPAGAGASATGDDEVLRAMVDVEAALLGAWGDVLGEPHDAAAAVLDAGALDRASLVEGVARDGVVVVALVPLLSAQLEDAGESSAHLHLGATSQDVVDSALMLVASRALADARDRLLASGSALAALAVTGRRDPRVARTLARPAAPSTLGVLAADWLDGVSSAVAAIDALEFPVQFGGAVGTGVKADAAAGRPGAADEVRAALAARLGLADPGRSWHTERSAVLAVAHAASTVVAALGRIGRDATLLSRPELGEVVLAGGGGSSAMPHKRNPVDAVALTAAAVEAPGLVATATAAASAADERPAGEWHAGWGAFRRLLALAESASAASARLGGGMTFDPERAADLLAASGVGAADDVVLAASDRIVDRAVARFAAVRDASNPGGDA
ncbi:3-carboxy-cis,cis-muconate cycloisomerase [Agromyces rhizosphaerae]|uniref:3-carboxy-cis,cis-muconate cycloisomerase n=1 Tax=Agromyces rhizosphaerae TaxID=88374 RepID=A0A9W6FQG2_9MICO|nr:lyase family protein [Agromyces rhizosphaerae]GLI26582.1 3-carboxy-cis,cis-muconate cycloisomerase [Agromyces rhizosphaerae]